MAMSVKQGDFVSVTTENLRASNGYCGNMKLNMIAKASHRVNTFDFRVEGEEDMFSSWLSIRDIKVLEPKLFEQIDLDDYSHLLCVNSETSLFTEGQYYPIDHDDMTITDDEDDDWCEGDHISNTLKFVGVTQEQYDATHGITAVAPVVEPEPTAEVIPFPTRTAFKDKSDAERGALLLAHHEGKVIQYAHVETSLFSTPKWLDDRDWETG